MNRIEELQRLMSGRADYALVSTGSNFYYLTGINPQASLERLFMLIVPSESEPFILAPKMYEAELRDASYQIYIWNDWEDPYKALNERLKLNKTYLIDDSLPASILLRIQESLSGTFFPLSSYTAQMRIIKSDEEIKYLKTAARIVDKVFINLTEKQNIAGLTEIEVAGIISELIKKYGAEGVSFDPIVAHGPASADPHHSPNRKKLRSGIIVLDYGAKYKGYCSDITRTIVIGKVPKKVMEIYTIVQMAQEKGVKAAIKGKMVKEIDLTVRQYIESKGYGNNFTHRTGHGIGLDVHEEPFITPTNKTVVQNGMTFTVEPGIYIEGKFGIRIEDDIVIREKGVRLTRTTRELLDI
ncbi:MAG: M24 family metallopeptidase [Nitrososphaeria archaeon]